MIADLSRFKVIYGNKVLNAIALDNVFYKDDLGETINEPKSIGVLAINENGNIVLIYDEAWRFQFIPIISRERSEG